MNPEQIASPLPFEATSHFTWDDAREYFCQRKAVIFVSYCRFWEKHAFVQQSIAKQLTDLGVDVIWFDGSGWRFYKPTFYWRSLRLSVKQLHSLPGNRLKFVSKLNAKWNVNQLLKAIKQYDNPVIWVQAGISDAIARKLPYIDVYSSFDDPFRCPHGGALVEKAKLILCQNRYTLNWMQQRYKEKSKLAWPPVDIRSKGTQGKDIVLPFPGQKTLGYVGSFFTDDFDLDLFEKFIQYYSNCNFVLMGRTDEAGLRKVKQLKQYSNFVHLSWVDPMSVGKVWKQLDLTLLFYKKHQSQNGAFPIKVLESFYYGTPCVSTLVPKTMDLEGWVPMSNRFEDLILFTTELLKSPCVDTSKAFRFFSDEMDPKKYLVGTAYSLQNQIHTPKNLLYSV